MEASDGGEGGFTSPSQPSPEGKPKPLRQAEQKDFDMIEKIKNDSGHIVGTYDPERKTFTRRIQGSRHLLRSPKAVCMDESIYLRLGELGCEWLVVEDVESGVTYRARFLLFEEKQFPINRGFGHQVGMELRFWNKAEQAAKDSQPLLFFEGAR
ncbi:MAG: hypothetical protein ABSB41_00970 [Anaerolineales bacterium]|jgi:hypothetical protein